MSSLRERMCNSARQLLVAKSSAIVVGITLKNSLTLTVIALVIQGPMTMDSASGSSDASPGDTWKTFAIVVVTFLLLIISATMMTSFIQSMESIPPKLKDTYVAGVVLIPAWAWKDVIAALMTTLGVVGVLHKDSKRDAAAFALASALLCSLLQIFLEVMTANFDKASIVACVVASLMTCFALGVGFAVDTAIHAVCGEKIFSGIRFQFAYALTMSTLVPMVQEKVTHLLTPERRKEWYVAATKTLDFLTAALNFVLGWAWKGLFDAWLLDYAMQGLTEQLEVSLIITGIGIVAQVVITLVGAPPEIVAVSALAAGMNIGWTWMAFAAACVGEDDVGLGGLWLQTVITLCVVVTIASVAEWVISTIEKLEVKHLLDAVPGKSSHMPKYGATDVSRA